MLLKIIGSLVALIPVVYGEPASQVVGGQPAEGNGFPFQVSIRTRGIHICGGAIISPRHVLTAAHCVFDITDPSVMAVLVGKNGQNSGQEYKVLNYKYHEDYDINEPYENDVGLITIANDLKFSATIKPVLFPITQSQKNSIVTASASGQNVELTIVDNKVCQDYYNVQIYPEQVCISGVGGKGVCVGEVGDPIIENNELVSILSWGTPCAIGVPNVGTRVFSYISWIENAMNS